MYSLHGSDCRRLSLWTGPPPADAEGQAVTVLESDWCQTGGGMSDLGTVA